MEWPKITVVTPTFNRPEFLQETIESVLSQGYPNLEYIIVDGGSTDRRVLEIIRNYESRLAWWLSEPDRGHAEAIRKGFERSTGQVLAWLCSDDTYLPGALLAVGEVFRASPSADVVYGNMCLIDESGQVLREFRAVPYSRLAAFTAMNLHQPSAFWTRSLYERVGGKVGGVDGKYNVYEPNVDLFYRFVNANARFVFLRKSLSNSRTHAGAVSWRWPGECRNSEQEVLRREFPFWSRPGIYQLCRFAMRIRQLYWYIRQGDIDYVWHTLRCRLPKYLNRKGQERGSSEQHVV